MTVTLYSKPSCQQCIASERKLNDKGIPFNYVDVYEDAEALERIKDLGYLQAPVIVTDDDHWSGYRPDKIEEISIP